MPEYELERPGKPKPLIVLPRGPLRDENGIEHLPAVKIFVELAKGVAGCCFCDAPIPKETTRFCLVVALPIAEFTKTGRERRTEKYYAHSGCLGGLLGQETKRTKYTCWDCGAPPPQDAENRYGASFHPYSVFTTTKFAAARLCSVCARKPKWRQCAGCHVMYPLWMISEVVEDLEARMAAYNVMSDFDDPVGMLLYPRGDGHPLEVCDYCASRANVRTKKVADAEKADFEETRRRIAEEGIFGED